MSGRGGCRKADGPSRRTTEAHGCSRCPDRQPGESCRTTPGGGCGPTADAPGPARFLRSGPPARRAGYARPAPERATRCRRNNRPSARRRCPDRRTGCSNRTGRADGRDPGTYPGSLTTWRQDSATDSSGLSALPQRSIPRNCHRFRWWRRGSARPETVPGWMYSPLLYPERTAT